MATAKTFNPITQQWEIAIVGGQGPAGADGALNAVAKVNGTVTTASTSSTVVRNITLSTSAPSGGMDGDVWMQYS